MRRYLWRRFENTVLAIMNSRHKIYLLVLIELYESPDPTKCALDGLSIYRVSVNHIGILRSGTNITGVNALSYPGDRI